MRMKRWMIIPILIALLAGSCGIYQKQKYRISDRKELRKIGKINPARIHHIAVGDYALRVMIVGDTNLPVTVLIHGAPGSLSRFNPILSDTSFTNHHRFIAIDRPGYGYSHFGHADTSISHQAQLIFKAINNFLPNDHYTLLGVSFGGPIAATIAGMDTNRVNKMVLVSSAVGPGLEKIYDISYLIDKKPFRYIFPTFIRVANDEKLSHENALCEVTTLYSQIKARVLMFHGTSDRLVYYSNTAYCKAVFRNVPQFQLVSKKGRHGVFMWDNEKLFKENFKLFLNN